MFTCAASHVQPNLSCVLNIIVLLLNDLKSSYCWFQLSPHYSFRWVRWVLLVYMNCLVNKLPAERAIVVNKKLICTSFTHPMTTRHECVCQCVSGAYYAFIVIRSWSRVVVQWSRFVVFWSRFVVFWSRVVVHWRGLSGWKRDVFLVVWIYHFYTSGKSWK